MQGKGNKVYLEWFKYNAGFLNCEMLRPFYVLMLPIYISKNTTPSSCSHILTVGYRNMMLEKRMW